MHPSDVANPQGLLLQPLLGLQGSLPLDVGDDHLPEEEPPAATGHDRHHDQDEGPDDVAAVALPKAWLRLRRLLGTGRLTSIRILAVVG